MIRVDGVHKAYGRTAALTDVSFEIGAGQLCGFVGPNGAGKTTALRIIAGYLAADRGAVTVDGVSMADQPRRAAGRIAYLPEHNALYGDMRVEAYLRFRARVKGVARRGVAEAVDRALAAANLGERRRSVISTLSRGFRQRVGIADAVVAAPAALLLDEPMAGLDPVQVREFRELVRGLAGEHTVLLSSHDLAQIESLCERVVVLVGGRVVADGAPDQLRGDRSLEDVFVELAASDDHSSGATSPCE